MLCLHPWPGGLGSAWSHHWSLLRFGLVSVEVSGSTGSASGKVLASIAAATRLEVGRRLTCHATLLAAARGEFMAVPGAGTGVWPLGGRPAAAPPCLLGAQAARRSWRRAQRRRCSQGAAPGEAAGAGSWAWRCGSAVCWGRWRRHRLTSRSAGCYQAGLGSLAPTA